MMKMERIGVSFATFSDVIATFPISAAGPFTNSKGVPIPGMTLQGQTDDNPMKCVCDAIADF